MKKAFLIAIALTVACMLVIAAIYKNLPTPQHSLPEGVVADRVLVDKSDHTLTIFKNDLLLKTYNISLGRGGLEPKQQEGDKKTPDGIYVIDWRNEKSSFYRSLHISYPDKKDIERAQRQNVSAGSHIMIHGLRNGFGFFGRFHLLTDWTQGCVAVTNAEMDELWKAIPDGTPIEIR